MGAAIAEFKRSGMAEADVATIVSAAGVAHGTFFFHFPTKEHVLLELEQREELRMAKQLGRFAEAKNNLPSTLSETLRLLLNLERRLGIPLFNDFLALHFSQTRPRAEGPASHPVVVCVAEEIARARDRGEVDPEVNPTHSAVFFLLGLYALLTTTHELPEHRPMLDDYLTRTIRGMSAT